MKRNNFFLFATRILSVCTCINSQASNQIKTISFPLNQYPTSDKAPTLHDEILGTFVFKQYSSELLLLTATLEKKHLVYALKKEGSCTLEQMIRVCGNKYLIENLTITANDQLVQLKQESLSVGKDFVTLTYTIPIPKQVIKHIKVTSDYMFKYNNHSILKVIFGLTGPSRIFNLRNEKRSINAKF